MKAIVSKIKLSKLKMKSIEKIVEDNREDLSAQIDKLHTEMSEGEAYWFKQLELAHKEIARLKEANENLQASIRRRIDVWKEERQQIWAAAREGHHDNYSGDFEHDWGTLEDWRRAQNEASEKKS